MIPPVACFTCDNRLSLKFKQYYEAIQSGINEKKAIDDLGLRRICCRTVIITSINLINDLPM